MAARVVIAGGMGKRAQDIFREQGIQAIVGAAAGPAEEIVQAFLDGNLIANEDPCDH